MTKALTRPYSAGTKDKKKKMLQAPKTATRSEKTNKDSQSRSKFARENAANTRRGLDVCIIVFLDTLLYYNDECVWIGFNGCIL